MKAMATLFLLSLFTVAAFAQPSSDNCSGIINLGVAPTCDGTIYTNVDATISQVYSNPTFNIPTCWSIVNHDVWAHFTVPAVGIVDFIISISGTQGGPNDLAILQPRLAIYRGNCQMDGLAELFCAEATPGENLVELVAEGLTPGLTYFLRIDDLMTTGSPNWGDFEICVEEFTLGVTATSSLDVICFGQSFSLEAEVTGEATSVTWEPANLFSNPNGTQPTLNGLLSETTTFTVTATAEGLASVTDEITIFVSNPTIVIDPIMNASCTGICDGSVEATVIGTISGTSQVAYAWSNGSFEPTITALCAGDYGLTVVDNLGCEANASITINETIFSISAFSTTNPCSSGATGSATAQILAGGAAPFTYAWSNGANTADVSNLAEGTYQVTVEDANGCNATAEVEITVNPVYTAMINASTDAICQGEQVTLTAPAPPAGSTLMWNTGAGTSSITVSPAQTTTYSLNASAISENIIRNGDFEAGDTEFTTDYIPGPGGAWGILSVEGSYAVNSNSANVHSNFPSCTDFSGTGNMLIVNGSNDPDDQIWCQTLTVAPNTDYLFATWGMTVITENPAILQFSIGNELLGTPFTLPFNACQWNSFNETWNSGSNTIVDICIVNQNTQLSGNDFALDNISLTPICNSFDEITITVSELDASIADQSNVTCQGAPGSAVLQVTGDAAPFTYLWDNGETSLEAIGLDAGNHQVTVSNSLGCENILSVDIGQDDQITIDALAVSELLCGEMVDGASTILNASITVENSQGTPPFSYSINGGAAQMSTIFENLSAGDYELTVQDADGCLASALTTIAPLVFPPTPVIAPSEESFCNTSFAIELSVGNADEFASFSWSTGETEAVISVEEAGSYELTAFDELNCAATASLSLDDCSGYEIPNIFSPNRDGVNDVFRVFHGGTGFEFTSLTVFNRWGRVVFETTTNEPWDGTLNGEAVPSDVFIYQAVFQLNGERKEERGALTLVR